MDFVATFVLSIFEWSLVPSAVAHRLISDTAVIRAIWQFVRCFAAAEEEVPATGITHRPTAGLLRQLQKGLALLDRNFNQLRLRLEVIVICKRGIAAHRRPWNTHHMSGRAGLAWSWRCRGGAFGTSRKSQPVNLADHRIPGDPPEFGRDLASG